MKSPATPPRKSAEVRKVPIGERALIASIRDRAKKLQSSKSPVRIGIGDDCAVLRPLPREELVVTTDFSLEQVHFRRDWHPPESVGHRCLARGLSDLAACGAQPLAAFLSLAIPADLNPPSGGKEWLSRFFDGLLALAEQYKVPLAGGDTTQCPEFDCRGRRGAAMIAVDIVLLGSVKRGRALLRSGARPGDIIYVTGALGGAAAELLALGRNPSLFAELTKAQKHHPHLYPEPRIKTGLRLASATKTHAAIDVSDGLSTDLLHLCEESGLDAELDVVSIPVHPLAQRAEKDGWVPSALGLALHGGEDYEVLFTAPRRSALPQRLSGVDIHPIGRMEPRSSRSARVILREPQGQKRTLEPGGWEHFKSIPARHAPLATS
jgi:thiamine-monophosphate kinase